jgi:hypothetical protein
MKILKSSKLFLNPDFLRGDISEKKKGANAYVSWMSGDEA